MCKRRQVSPMNEVVSTFRSNKLSLQIAPYSGLKAEVKLSYIVGQHGSKVHLLSGWICW